MKRFDFFCKLGCLLIGLWGATTSLKAQNLVENFTDGDFTNNPTWGGNTTAWIVNAVAAKQLQLQTTVTVNSTSYMSVPAATSLGANTTWEFYAFENFSPATTNYGRVYLGANTANLSGSLNGYYVKLGGITGATDALELYRQDGNTSVLLISGTASSMGGATATAKVRVTRSTTGGWELFADYTGGTAYVSQGTATDNTYNILSHFGVWATFTPTRANHFYFDDILVSPLYVDVAPPTVDTVIAISGTQVDVLFNEALNPASANIAANYLINNGINVTNAAIDGTNPALVHLTVTNLVSGTNYTLTANGVRDLALNPISNGSKQFTYILIQAAAFGDILINELMADPTPVVGQPNVEYIELFNRSNKYIQLNGYNIFDGSNKPLTSYVLAPNAYLLIVPSSSLASFAGVPNKMGVSSLALTNSGELIQLFDNGGAVIDSITFSDAWYQDLVKQQGGWSLELRNPNLVCKRDQNWIASTNASGGTPGAQNSVFSNVPDNVAPSILSANYTSNTQILLTFDDVLNATNAANAANYTVSGRTVTSAVFTYPDKVTLTVNTAFIDQTNYTVTVGAAVNDCVGNPISTQNTAAFLFIQLQPAALGDIIINELMADPTPIVGQPNVEYVELYNRSNKYIDLANYVFFDGVNHTLASKIMPPNTYLILCSDVNLDSFVSFPNKLGIGTIALTNAGELLKFSDNNGLVIDSITYSDAWYQDAVKQQGGWSLELKNPNLLCKREQNWIASTNASGGTPGVQNSIFNNIPDNVAPALVSATASGNIQVQLTFDDILNSTNATNPANYTVTGRTVIGANFVYPNKVILTVNAAFTDQTNYTVTVGAGVNDCVGNAISAQNTANFLYVVMQPAVFGDIIINEIMADPTPVVGQPNVEYVELHNRSTKYIDIANYAFFDGANHILPSHIMPPNSYLLLCSDVNLDSFPSISNKMGVGAMALTNAGELLKFVDNNGAILDSITYSDAWYQDVVKQQGGWSLEVKNPNLLCQRERNWAACTFTVGGSPGIQNSVFNNLPDNTPPDLLNATYTSGNQILLTFSKQMDVNTLQNPANFSISTGSIISATLVSATQVQLTVSPAFVNATFYTVTALPSVEDCAGNPISVLNKFVFAYYDILPAQLHDIIFNELMIDPTPVVGLPETEYIELYNRSNHAVSLQGLKLTHRSNTSSTVNQTTLPAYTLLAGEYVILQSSSDTSYSLITKKVPVSSFPSLNNTSAALVLRDANGGLIDSILYFDYWYRDANKKSGGWSLELIDPLEICKEGNNWIASNATSGGTPATQNSVYDVVPDLMMPQILSIDIINPTQINLNFDEPLNAASANNMLNYNLSGGLAVLNAALSGYSTVFLTLSSPMVHLSAYTITVNNTADCIGNPTVNVTKPFNYYETVPATQYAVIINEIYADTNPRIGLPGKPYIELFNRTNNYINLKDFTLHDNSTRVGTLPNFVLFPNAYVVLCSDEDTSGTSPLGNRLFVSNMPDLNVSSETVTIKTPNGLVIDAVAYTTSSYGNSNKSEGGWALERINPNQPCLGASNWIASTNPIGGTPSQANSVLQTTPDQQAPIAIRAFPTANNQVRLFFDESVSVQNSQNAANYSLTGGISVSNIRAEAPFFNTLLLNLSSDLQTNQVYTISFTNGFTDCVGNPIAGNAEVKVALPKPILAGDVILNELLFNPITGGSDFVELYNKSDKIVNLSELIFANTNELGQIDRIENLETDYLLFPQQFVVVSPNISQVKQQYNVTDKHNFVQNSLPTYDDSEGTFLMYTTSSGAADFVDKFEYKDDYHSPLLRDENGVSLERIDYTQPTNDRQNWHSAAAKVNYGTPSYQNSAYMGNSQSNTEIVIDEEKLSPDGDGYQDFLLIRYNMDRLGYVARVQIYDAVGRPIKMLVDAELFGQEGFLQWDGSNDKGEKASTGIYIVEIQLTHPSGTVKRYRKNCVVASKL